MRRDDLSGGDFERRKQCCGAMPLVIAVVVHSDFAPGTEASRVFVDRFTNGGGQILEIIKVPLVNPDFAPFLQRARDLHPDALLSAHLRRPWRATLRQSTLEQPLGHRSCALVRHCVPGRPAGIFTALEAQLGHESEKTRRGRITGLLRPQYRLRVGASRFSMMFSARR